MVENQIHQTRSSPVVMGGGKTKEYNTKNCPSVSPEDAKNKNTKRWETPPKEFK